MSKYTAEQARDWRRRESSWRNQLGMYESKRKHSEMADAIDALLRERESAKAAVTDEIFEAFDAAQTKAMGEYEMQQYHAGKESHLVHAPNFATRAALEAVAPMLASARVPDGWQLVPVDATPAMQSAGGHANSEWLNDNAPIGENRYGGPVMRSVWQAMLAAAGEPNHDA